MKNNMFDEIADRLAPILKNWVKEALHEHLSENQPSLEDEQVLPKPDEYLSPTQVCKLLGISLPTLRKYTRQGLFKAYRLGNRKIQYRRCEIDASLLDRPKSFN